MAPVLDKSSPLVTAEVTIAGVKVVALIDTGATSSCCRWGWYDQWKAHLGPLRQTDTLVIGVGNVPVELKGITQALELEWESVVDHCEMMVLSTLEDVDVILGMDIISRLDVQIKYPVAGPRARSPDRRVSPVRSYDWAKRWLSRLENRVFSSWPIL